MRRLDCRDSSWRHRSGLALALILVAMVGIVRGQATKQFHIQLRRAGLREQPHELEKPNRYLAYATKVDLLERHGVWAKVQEVGGESAAGWLYTSGLTETPLFRRTEDVPPDLKKQRGSLAQVSGKGFGDKDVKREFLKLKPDVDSLDFALVDSIEKREISLDEVKAFLADGGLKPSGRDSL